MQRIEDVGETAPFRALRGRILVYLYDWFRKFPYAPVELSQIKEACETNPPDLNWNIVYLEKRGLVELGKMLETPPYVACTASISARGIDMVEDPESFKSLFS